MHTPPQQLKMDLVLAVKSYISKMIENSGPGMKAIIMDKETTGVVSLVFAQSEILQKEVYLFEQIEGMSTDPLKHVKAIVFVRPTSDNVQLLTEELKRHRYGKYYLYFSHALNKSDIKRLAESDEHEAVCDILEYFADFYPVDVHHFTLNIPNCSWHSTWNQAMMARSSHGITSVLLALKKNPVIRYQGNSEMCRQLADSVNHFINREPNLFDFRRQESKPLLLLLDRRNDTITPMLNQWTYQAMAHELLGIRNGRVDLSNVPNISKELQEVVLSPLHDQFYRDNLYKNFGEIGSSIKDLMDDFQAKTQSQHKVESIDDMKAFVENYPQFKKMSGTVSKHVTVVGELSRLVGSKNLLEISECEQDIACQNDHTNALQRVKQLIKHPKTNSLDALRLVALYTLKYKSHSNNASSSLTDQLKSKEGKRIINALMKYSRLSSSADMKNPISYTKKLFKGLKGVENVYTQHEPVLKEILDQACKARLRESDFPFIDGKSDGLHNDIIVFIVGGSTYEEIACVDLFNQVNPGFRVILGGTTVHNTLSFIDELMTSEGIQS